jgi:hypothetical protein
MRCLLWVLAGCFGVMGCTALIGVDFDKATLVSDVELGSATVYTRKVTPPIGSADLIVAIPNHRCAAPIHGPIAISLTDERGNRYSARVLLSQLTWSHAIDSCDAYGYLNGSSVDVSSSKRPPMQIDVRRDQGPLTFEIDVSRIAAPAGRTAKIWLIYSHRVPGARIYSDKQ